MYSVFLIIIIINIIIIIVSEPPFQDSILSNSTKAMVVTRGEGDTPPDTPPELPHLSRARAMSASNEEKSIPLPPTPLPRQPVTKRPLTKPLDPKGTHEFFHVCPILHLYILYMYMHLHIMYNY